MKVHFEVREVLVKDEALARKVLKPVEHLVADIHGDGKEVLNRVATDEDRHAYRAEYLAFRPTAADDFFRMHKAEEPAPAPAPAPEEAAPEESPAAPTFFRSHKPKAK